MSGSAVGMERMRMERMMWRASGISGHQRQAANSPWRTGAAPVSEPQWDTEQEFAEDQE